MTNNKIDILEFSIFEMIKFYWNSVLYHLKRGLSEKTLLIISYVFFVSYFFM